MASDNAAKQLLELAKNRLNKFYNKALYKAPPKRQLTEEERISVNFGGTMAPTAAPGGIAGTGVTAFADVAPPPPPQAVEAYKTKGQESTGVIAMIDLLIGDLDKEIAAMTTEEKDNQAEYESYMGDSAKKRAADSASVAEKEGAKADAEASLVSNEGAKTSAVKEAMATAEHISALHGECDWLVSNFEARKEARAAEVDSLKNAKAILAGADFSLVQINRHEAQAVCGPQTKVCTAPFADAASNPQWECKPASSGAKVKITAQEAQFGAKTCGPGKFFFSPMQCDGDHFEYKQQTVEVDASSTTTECTHHTFDHTMACYSVEC